MALNSNGNWQPQNLRERSRAARFAPPPDMMPPGLPPGVASYSPDGQPLGTTGGIVPGAPRRDPVPTPWNAPGGGSPGMPMAPAMPTAAPGIPPGMPPAMPPTAGAALPDLTQPPPAMPRAPGLPPLPTMQPDAGRAPGLPPLPSMPLSSTGPIYDGPPQIPGLENFDPRMAQTARRGQSLAELLANPQLLNPPTINRNTGTNIGELPPNWDPATRTLRQTPESLAAAELIRNTPPPPIDPGAFASEAARRAVREGRDPIAARKAAEAIMPGASRVGQTVDVAGQKYVYTQEGNLSPVKGPEVPADRSTEAERLFNTLTESGVFSKSPDELTPAEREQLKRWGRFSDKGGSLEEVLKAFISKGAGDGGDDQPSAKSNAPASGGTMQVDPSFAGRRVRGPDGKVYTVSKDGKLNTTQ